MRFFISYASDHRALAEPIAFSLRNRGYTVFFDKDDLPPGQSYDDQIQDAIMSSDFFIFLITPESVQEGRFTLTEIKFARKKWQSPGHHVLPVMAVKTDYSQIPSYLKAVTILNPIGNLTAETAEAAENLARTYKEDKKLPFKQIALGAFAAAAVSVGAFKGGDIIDFVTNQAGECSSELSTFIQDDKDVRDFSGAEIEERLASGRDLHEECEKYPSLAFQTRRVENLLSKYSRTREAHSHLIKMKDFIAEFNSEGALQNLDSINGIEPIINRGEQLRNTFQNTEMHHFVDGQAQKQTISELLTNLVQKQNAIAGAASEQRNIASEDTSEPAAPLNEETMFPIFFLKDAWRSAQSVARIQLDDNFATGFLVSPHLLLTATYAIPERSLAKNAEAEFDYYIGSKGLVSESSSFQLNPDLCFLSNDELGYSMVAIDEDSSSNRALDEFQAIQLEKSELTIGIATSIIHIPNGSDKAVSLLDGKLIATTENSIRYNNFTLPGSGGAPVFNHNWKAIGLHHKRTSATEREGLSIRAIALDIKKQIDSDVVNRQTCEYIDELEKLAKFDS